MANRRDAKGIQTGKKSQKCDANTGSIRLGTTFLVLIKQIKQMLNGKPPKGMVSNDK